MSKQTITGGPYDAATPAEDQSWKEARKLRPIIGAFLTTFPTNTAICRIRSTSSTTYGVMVRRGEAELVVPSSTPVDSAMLLVHAFITLLK